MMQCTSTKERHFQNIECYCLKNVQWQQRFLQQKGEKVCLELEQDLEVVQLLLSELLRFRSNLHKNVVKHKNVIKYASQVQFKLGCPREKPCCSEYGYCRTRQGYKQFTLLLVL